MANTLDFSIKMAAMFSGNVQTQLPGVISKLDELSKKTKALQTTSKNITGFQKASQQLESSRQKLALANENVKRLRQNLSQTTNPSQAMKKEFTRANQEAARMREIVQANMRTLGDYRSALTGAGVDVNHLADAHRKLQSDTERVAAAQKRLTDAQSKYASIKSQLFDWGNIKADFIKSAGTLMALKQPVIIDMEFEQAMANVRAVMNPLQEEFDALRNQALELGRTTQFSASQAAASQENLARAGFTTKQILDTMPGLLSMAAAEGMDLAQAATILAGGLRGMNLDMSQTMRLADAFAYTSAHSATNITNLGEAFKAVAATASLQGASPEQLLSYLGVLANLQVEASEAGNAIKSAFMRLSNPAKEAQNVLSRFGIQVVKNGRMRELGNLLEELYTKTEKLGAAEQLKAFSIIFGKNYGDSLIKLARGVMSGDQQNLLVGLMNDKAGASDLMAGMRNDTLKGDLTALSSAWEGFNIAIGAPLQDILRNIVQNLTTAISKVTEFINKNKEIVEPLIKIGAILASMSVVATIYKYGKLIVSLPFAKLNVLLAEQAAQAALAGQSFSVMGTIMNALTHPLAALKSAFSLLWGVVAAHPFMALIAVASAIYFYWDDIVKLWHSGLEWFSAKWEWLKEFWANLSFPDLFAELKDKLNTFAEYFSHKWDEFKNWLALPDVFAPMKEFFDNAVNYIKEKWQGVIDWFKSFNPFSSWSAPAAPSVTVGGVKHDTGGSKQVENALRAINGMASGGIVREHSIIQVAENGPEIIIPLKDKSRGLALLNVASEKLQAHAQGGIFSQPHIGLVAEAGPEAIIPLKNKSRGLTLLSQTADKLGVNWPKTKPSNDTFNSLNNSIQEDIAYNGLRNFKLFNNVDNAARSFDNSDMVQRPSLTFNINVSGENEGLADRIAAAVRNVLDNLNEYEERVAYA